MDELANEYQINEMKVHALRINGGYFKVRVHKGERVSFYGQYGPQNDKIRLRWYFNQSGMLKHIGFDFRSINKSIDLIHIDYTNNPNLENILLYPERMKFRLNELEILQEAHTGAYGLIPPEIRSVSRRFESLNLPKAYQHLLFIGGNIARDVEATIQRGVNFDITPGQLQITELDDPGREIIKKIGEKFVHVGWSRTISDCLELKYDEYLPQRRTMPELKESHNAE